MVGSDTLEHRVIIFAADYVGLPVNKVNLQSTLPHDLGLDGDDAWEFMTKFANLFSVDLSEFNFGRHFGPEPSAFGLIVLLYNFAFGPKNPLIDIQVGDLVRTAKSGKWTYKTEME